MVGRHTAIVQTEDVEYTIPFVYADYVIRDFSGVLGLIEYYTANDTIATASTISISNKYITVANNVVCEATDFVYPSTITSVNLNNSTFDGYGHVLEGLHIGQGCKGLLGNLTGSTIVKDLALVDLVLNNTGGGTSGLCGSISSTSKIENVFIAGSGTLNKDNVYLLAQEIQGKIENCVVIDNSYARFGNTGKAKNYTRAVLGKMKATATSAKLTNIVLQTYYENYALSTGDKNGVNGTNSVDASLSDSRVNNLTRVEHTATEALVTALEAFVMLENNFTYDADTYTLYLNGNAIYTVA
jgi:hypothetical protein